MKLTLFILGALTLVSTQAIAEEASKGKCVPRGRASFDTKCASKEWQNEKTCTSGKDGTSCSWEASRPGGDDDNAPPAGNGGATHAR